MRDESLSDERIKHLEFIQNIVTRLATNSFFIKGWAVTVLAALYAFEAKNPSWRIGIVGFLPVLAFWLLDSYYLRQERLFRCLYNDVRQANSSTEPFSMNIAPYYYIVKPSKVAISYTIMIYYGPLLGLALTYTTISFF
ncbi:hypothetical protein GCM10027290_58960 [Micromonospora sonneratiae]|uniref:Uncharacterized protein n=1 Tax=Micromonospora sonneratiae TaxID=1184706 RepID=A0ABW3Y847_9ACTN